MVLLLGESESFMMLPDWLTPVLLTLLIVGRPISIYLAWNYERSPQGFVRTTSDKSWQNPYTASQRKPLTSNFIITALVLVIIVMYVYPRYTARDQTGSSITPPDKSIAVLPFANIGEQKESQYFADG